MSKNKTTYTPWEAFPGGKYQSPYVESPKNQERSEVVIAVYGTTYLSDAENWANAKLGAAAPDLLEALQACISELYQLEGNYGKGVMEKGRLKAVQMAEAAIIKATIGGK